jgi:hypothetical protein
MRPTVPCLACQVSFISKSHFEECPCLGFSKLATGIWRVRPGGSNVCLGADAPVKSEKSFARLGVPYDGAVVTRRLTIAKGVGPLCDCRMRLTARWC